MTWLHILAAQRKIPSRTLEEVRSALEDAKKEDADKVLARVMLRHGRLTDEARAYVAREYPQ